VSGFIKLHRKIQNSFVWEDSNKYKLWSYCLLEATHTQKKVVVEGQVIELEKGQFVTGRNKLEREFNRGVKLQNHVQGLTLYRWLELFKKMKILNIKKTNKYSVITILNWSKYQINEQQNDNKTTSNEQQNDTYKKERSKEVKNKDLKDICASFDEFWSIYPKKRDKDSARKLFTKHYQDGQWLQKVLDSLEAQKISDDWKKENGKYIPLPSTWLNKKRWEDKLETDKPSDEERFTVGADGKKYDKYGVQYL